MQRLLGYAATGEHGEHVLPIWYGTGNNGKSTLSEAVSGVLGSYAYIAPDGLLVMNKHDKHEERVASLRGRRFVISSELETRVRMAEAFVKSLTGDAMLSARELYGRRFQFRPAYTIVLLTNKEPVVTGRDLGIWRRLRTVPFLSIVKPEDRVQDYGDKLASEHGQAILAWLVEGSREWYANGLGTCRGR